MHATPGDWLVTERSTAGGPGRRGRIEEVRGRDGAPPYLVHWADTGHLALVFPGPDAHVLSVEQLHSRRSLGHSGESLGGAS